MKATVIAHSNNRRAVDIVFCVATSKQIDFKEALIVPHDKGIILRRAIISDLKVNRLYTGKSKNTKITITFDDENRPSFGTYDVIKLNEDDYLITTNNN